MPRMMRIKMIYLHQIRSREKKVEIRVAYSGLKNIQSGTLVNFCSGNESQLVMISEVRRYADFVSMLKVEKPEDVIAGEKNVAKVLSILRSIYSPDKEGLGVIVLQLELQ
ncbi:MAG: ASCH domain-containing protein [Patescibacteria group bacterium]|jgi:ASC-1-like (ASCH) protein